MKLYEGRLSGKLGADAEKLNSSIGVDFALYEYDVRGSIAQAEMLKKQKIISASDAETIVEGLLDVLCEIQSGALKYTSGDEDVHSFIERALVEKIGATGKKLHTARSRNDQVALDERLYLKVKIKEIVGELYDLISSLVDLSDRSKDVIIAGYTHMQRAQAVRMSQYYLAYCQMFLRDVSRFKSAYKLMNYCPLGSAALAGTGYDIDREFTSEALGFTAPTSNSMDGVSDRDYIIETLSDIALTMTHLSRLSEELIIFSTTEFGYIQISDEFSTGSSIMPQKKNPDICELVRGKTGRTYGNLMAMLTTMKGLPLAYNKDMQEDKEALFDSVDTVLLCLKTYAEMLPGIKINKEKALASLKGGYLNATDAADYLTKKGLPFREAYKCVGKLTAYAIEAGKELDELKIEEFKQFNELFDEGVYKFISVENTVENRKSFGGVAMKEQLRQIAEIKEYLKNNQKI